MIIGGASHAECARTHTRRAPRHGDACARGPQQRTSTRVASSGQPSKDYSAWKPPRRGQRGEASRGARARPLLARPFSSSCAGHRCSSRPQEDRTVPRHAQAWGSAAGATASTDAGGVASWSESLHTRRAQNTHHKSSPTTGPAAACEPVPCVAVGRHAAATAAPPGRNGLLSALRGPVAAGASHGRRMASGVPEHSARKPWVVALPSSLCPVDRALGCVAVYTCRAFAPLAAPLPPLHSPSLHADKTHEVLEHAWREQSRGAMQEPGPAARVRGAGGTGIGVPSSQCGGRSRQHGRPTRRWSPRCAFAAQRRPVPCWLPCCCFSRT